MAKKQKKVIITAAITGGIHTPTMSDALPYTPKQIARQAIDSVKAGASIIHLHARKPQNGMPTGDPEIYKQFLLPIKEETDAIINMTTGGGLNMTVEQRLEAPLRFKPEMTSLNMGSMNFALYPLASKYKTWKFDWEKPFLEASSDFIFRNTFADIKYISERLGKEHGVRFELECYDVGHLYNLAHVIDMGWIKPPFFIQTIFGVLGAIGADPENLMFMKQTADKLFGNDYYWSVLAAGRAQIPFTTQAASMGGNVRVGLEDNLYIAKAKLAKDNAELVTKIRALIEGLGLQVASPDDVRAMLELKGQNNVGF